MWENVLDGGDGEGFGHRSRTVNIVRFVTSIAADRARVVTPAPAVVGLDLVALAEAAAARRPGPRPRSVLLTDQAFGDARLALAVIIGDVVGIVSAVSIYLPGVIASATAVIGFDRIALAETITASAVGIAAPAVERRDEAGLDSRLGFAIVLCERPLARDPKKISGAD